MKLLASPVLAISVALLGALFVPALNAKPVVPAGITEVQQIEGITEYRLANGLQVLLVPDATKPSTTVNVTYRVGSRHENYGETGMAHLLEHLLFKGTPTTRNALAEMSKRGLRANGSTSFDRTNYHATFAADDDNLRWYLSWQADAMVNSLIARADLDTEMTVVRNEFERGENDPFRVTVQQALASMYQWHNYGKSVIGARSDIENVNIGRLQAFYRHYYQPDNATLVVSGRFDESRVLAMVAQYFGPLPRPTRQLQPTYTVDPPQDGERSVTVRRKGGAPLVLMAWHVPAGSHPDYLAVEMLARILGRAPTGRLHKALVDKGLAARTFGSTWGVAEPGPAFLGASLAPGQDPEKAKAAMLATLDTLKREPITAEELERVRTQGLNEWAQGFADPETVGVSISGAIGTGDWRLYFLERDRLRALTLADVNRVAQTYFVRDNRTVGEYLPTEDTQRAPALGLVDVAAAVNGYRGDAAVAQAEQFDAKPALLDARTQSSTLASGLKLALLPKGTRGATVEARLTLRFGDETSLRGQGRAVSMMGALIDKGGAGMTRAQIQDAFDKLRAQVSFSAGGQSLNVGITTVREHLPATVALVGRLLREPAFPAEALEELRRQSLAGIASQRSEPGAIAANIVQRHGNPYARGDLRYVSTFDEAVQDVQAVDVAAVRAAHRRFVSAASGEFSAAGDFDSAAVRQAVDRALGDWKAPADGALAFVRVPQPLQAAAPMRQLVATPDKANANMVAIQSLPINDTHPDYPALLVANYLLGGSSSSRLWMRIREKDGLSYDVRTQIGWSNFEPNSRLQSSAIFAPQNQAKVETAWREEIERARAEGFSASELAQAKKALLSTRRLARAQDDGLSGALGSNAYLGRQFALMQRVDDALEALTLEQVNAAYRQYVDPTRWVLVWAGDFKQP